MIILLHHQPIPHPWPGHQQPGAGRVGFQLAADLGHVNPTCGWLRQVHTTFVGRRLVRMLRKSMGERYVV